MNTVVREDDVEDEVILAEGWDNSIGDPTALLQVTAMGSLLKV